MISKDLHEPQNTKVMWKPRSFYNAAMQIFKSISNLLLLPFSCQDQVKYQTVLGNSTLAMYHRDQPTHHFCSKLASRGYDSVIKIQIPLNICKGKRGENTFRWPWPLLLGVIWDCTTALSIHCTNIDSSFQIRKHSYQYFRFNIEYAHTHIYCNFIKEIWLLWYN